MLLRRVALRGSATSGAVSTGLFRLDTQPAAGPGCSLCSMLPTSPAPPANSWKPLTRPARPLVWSRRIQWFSSASSTSSSAPPPELPSKADFLSQTVQARTRSDLEQLLQRSWVPTIPTATAPQPLYDGGPQQANDDSLTLSEADVEVEGEGEEGDDPQKQPLWLPAFRERLQTSDYNLVLAAARRLNAPDLALQVFAALEYAARLEAQVVEAAAAAAALAKEEAGGPSAAAESQSPLAASGNSNARRPVAPNQGSWDALLLGLTDAGRYPQALQLFFRVPMARCSMIQVSAALRCAGRLGALEDAVRVLEVAQAAEIPLPLEAYHEVLRAVATGIDQGDPRWKYAPALRERLVRRGHQPSLETEMLVQRGIGRSGNVEQIMESFLRIEGLELPLPTGFFEDVIADLKTAGARPGVVKTVWLSFARQHTTEP